MTKCKRCGKQIKFDAGVWWDTNFGASFYSRVICVKGRFPMDTTFHEPMPEASVVELILKRYEM